MKKRSGQIIDIAVELTVFAAIGLAALILLATSSTAKLNPLIAFLAVTFISLLAIIGIAVAFIRKGGFTTGV